jgi:MFS family permease
MADPSPTAPAPPAVAEPLPRTGLWSRTFVGLLVAQFLAAFNDQAIHASAMFFAINTGALSERDAISLMPILFYAPWAIFCTVAGYLADRYSKRQSLVAWKLAEVAISAVACAGFWLGRNGHDAAGPWLVLATVFLMGTHSAFFVPAKYGVMPEILPPDQLSKGNGVLESLSFLAVILGTVSGGVLSFLYLGREVVIGGILVGLAGAGALASLLIRKMPAANPTRPFPAYVYGPIVANVRTLFAQPSLRLAVVGIAFFTFVVAFMRAAVYMLGESQDPRWDELKTSAVVGTVALGIGLGSPLAGYLSGKRVELRLVPLGAAGMILACLLGAAVVDRVPVLVGCIVGIGFCTGFYIVPLFTLLQHKAPKAGKGDAIATSNFINISGAISASLLFFVVVFATQKFGLVTEVSGRAETAGTLTKLEVSRGRPAYLEVARDDGTTQTAGTPVTDRPPTLAEVVSHVFEAGPAEGAVIEANAGTGVRFGRPPAEGDRVSVTTYKLGGTLHVEVVPEGQRPTPDFDRRRLPGFLFAGAGLMTAAMLAVIAPMLRRVRRDGV